MKRIIYFLTITTISIGCQKEKVNIPTVEQWTAMQLDLGATQAVDNPYTAVEVWATFTNDDGDSLVRPGFWDGGNSWKIRFAPPDTGSVWNWKSYSEPVIGGLSGITGSLRSVPYNGDNELFIHGFPKLSPGYRNVVYADGTSFLVVGDTPWAIPFRATREQVATYAGDRHAKGFNIALLMSLQPDRFAEGPEARNKVLAFDRAFEDLADGHLNVLKPDYFQYLDSLVTILVEHEIVPVYQPVFHGFGWKGKTVLGTTADPVEYARYCKYLVARYGSMPAFWLVSGDGTGRDPGVRPGGEIVEQWDCYDMPTGIHYSPADNYMPVWAQGDSSKCFHFNSSHQSEPWLDFQWAQSGHDGKHLTYKVEEMYENKPTKANLNGEPTYEGMGGGKFGLGWWQGHEAWTQLMHGGTMGVVYGAAGLWQWKVTTDEEGWGEWTDQPVSWREAIDLEGSTYVGLVQKAFRGYDFADMEKRWDLTGGSVPLLAKERVFYISYLAEGGEITIEGVPDGLPYNWFNPRTGEFGANGTVVQGQIFNAPDSGPWVFIVGRRKDNDVITQ